MERQEREKPIAKKGGNNPFPSFESLTAELQEEAPTIWLTERNSDGTEVRRISQNMMPAALLYSGLEGAIEDLAVQVRTSGLECNLEVVGDLN